MDKGEYKFEKFNRYGEKNIIFQFDKEIFSSICKKCMGIELENEDEVKQEEIYNLYRDCIQILFEKEKDGNWYILKEEYGNLFKDIGNCMSGRFDFCLHSFVIAINLLTKSYCDDQKYTFWIKGDTGVGKTTFSQYFLLLAFEVLQCLDGEEKKQLEDLKSITFLGATKSEEKNMEKFAAIANSLSKRIYADSSIEFKSGFKNDKCHYPDIVIYDDVDFKGAPEGPKVQIMIARNLSDNRAGVINYELFGSRTIQSFTNILKTDKNAAKMIKVYDYHPFCNCPYEDSRLINNKDEVMCEVCKDLYKKNKDNNLKGTKRRNEKWGEYTRKLKNIKWLREDKADTRSNSSNIPKFNLPNLYTNLKLYEEGKLIVRNVPFTEKKALEYKPLEVQSVLNILEDELIEGTNLVYYSGDSKIKNDSLVDPKYGIFTHTKLTETFCKHIEKKKRMISFSLP